jgi:periplasmic divalent cation tolerance protein
MFYLIFMTTKDREEARHIVERLVDERLVACANIIPGVSSIYLWKGKVERSEEASLVMKTSEEKLERLMNRVKELHSYEIPEILAVPIERGLPEYLKWLEENLK